MRHSRSPRTVTWARATGAPSRTSRSVAPRRAPTSVAGDSVGWNPMRRTRTRYRPSRGSSTKKLPRTVVSVRATTVPVESVTVTIAARAGVTLSE